MSFKPLFAGLRLGAVAFYSDANRSGTVLATVPVYGVGTGPQAAFEPGGAPSMIGGRIVSPAGVAVDAAGNVFITDLDSQKVFKVTPRGAKTAVGSGFAVPEAVAVDGAGKFYIADTYKSEVVQIERANPPSLQFDATRKGSTSKDSPRDIYVENIGNSALKLSTVAYAKDFPEGWSAGKKCASGLSVQPASNCTLSIDFQPVSSLGGKSSVALHEYVALTLNNLNTRTVNRAHVNGTETAK